MQLARGPLVEAATAERIELVAELVLVPPAGDVACDSAPGADLDDLASRRTKDAPEQRPRWEPASEHEVGPEPGDRGAHVESRNVATEADAENRLPLQLAALASAHPRLRALPFPGVGCDDTQVRRVRREGVRQVPVPGRDFQDPARTSGTDAPRQGAQERRRGNEVDGTERIELADLLELPASQRGDGAVERGRGRDPALTASVPQEARHDNAPRSTEDR